MAPHDYLANLRYVGKRIAQPLIHRYPPIGLQPERLYLWSQVLIETQDIPGNIVEVGCSVGGTAAWSSRMLDRLQSTKRYVCVDTFGGFVADQFNADVSLGTERATRSVFSANSMKIVERNIKQHGGRSVDLVKADIVSVDGSRLPQTISAALLDVDLYEPILAGLEFLHGRLAPGGVILVDDCPPESNWKARLAYSAFCKQKRLEEEYRFGMGIVRAANA